MVAWTYMLLLCYTLPSFADLIVKRTAPTYHGEHILILKYHGTLKWEHDDNQLPAISTQKKTSPHSKIISAIDPITEHKTKLDATFKNDSTASHLVNVQHVGPITELQAAKPIRARRDLLQVLRSSYEDMKSKYKTTEHQVKAKFDEIVDGSRQIRQKRNCFSATDARRRCHITNRKKRLLLEDNAGNEKNEPDVEDQKSVETKDRPRQGGSDSHEPSSDFKNVNRPDNIKTDAREEIFKNVSFNNDRSEPISHNQVNASTVNKNSANNSDTVRVMPPKANADQDAEKPSYEMAALVEKAKAATYILGNLLEMGKEPAVIQRAKESTDDQESVISEDTEKKCHDTISKATVHGENIKTDPPEGLVQIKEKDIEVAKHGKDKKYERDEKSKNTAVAGDKSGQTVKIKKEETAEREDLDTVVKEVDDSSGHEEEGNAPIAGDSGSNEKLGGLQ